MAAPVTPCAPWTSELEIRRVCPGLCEDPDPDLVVDAVWWASGVLYRLDGQRLRGVCTSTVSACYDSFTCGACHQESTGWEVSGPLGPVGWSGWYSVAARLEPSVADGRCACSTRCDDRLLLLPYAPIVAVEQVLIDGTDVTAEGFTLVDRRYLKRNSGACWPARARVQVTVTYGRPVPRDARSAASELACHWLLGHGAGSGCQLPEGLTSLSREELTLTVAPTILDAPGVLGALSGLPWVNRWLVSRRTPRRGARVLTTAAPPTWREHRPA